MDDALAVLCAKGVATALLTNTKHESLSVDVYATIIPQCHTLISLSILIKALCIYSRDSIVVPYNTM